MMKKDDLEMMMQRQQGLERPPKAAQGEFGSGKSLIWGSGMVVDLTTQQNLLSPLPVTIRAQEKPAGTMWVQEYAFSSAVGTDWEKMHCGVSVNRT